MQNESPSSERRRSGAAPPAPREDRPLIWVRTPSQLEEAVAALASEPVVGLDVETTLAKRTLCLIQIAGREATYLIDALELPDLEPLGRLLASGRDDEADPLRPVRTRGPRPAGFRAGWRASILARYRSGSGTASSGHSLREVCARELGVELDKREQAGDWTRRPLTESQVTYAALDAEVLLRLFAHFEEIARDLTRGVTSTA